LDYAKHKYQQTKKEQKQKSKTKQKETKSIRLSARIGDHDLAVKLRQAEKFLTKGHRIKVILILKGREKFHSEQGSAVINNFIKSLVSKSRIEKSPFRERNLIWAILTPHK
jgi:translation initiation factor IF-3